MSGIIDGMVQALNAIIHLKFETFVGDVVIIVYENERGTYEVLFALVMDYVPETANRQEWWRTRFGFLTPPLDYTYFMTIAGSVIDEVIGADPIPIGYATFIVTADQLTGKEIFTIEGRHVFIKAMVREKAQLTPVVKTTPAPAQPQIQPQPQSQPKPQIQLQPPSPSQHHSQTQGQSPGQRPTRDVPRPQLTLVKPKSATDDPD